MRNWNGLWHSMCALAMLAFSLGVAVAAEQPRFQDSSGKVLESLPLEFTQAQVQIIHGIAAVKLTQTFANRADTPLEAIYLFPGSAKSTVRGLTMTVGNRRIQAQIKKRNAAERTYTEAKTAGKTASLLKEVQVGTYELNVANILPGDQIKVEVDYVELLTPENGEYRLLLANTFGVDRYGETRSPNQRAGRSQSASDTVVKDAYFVSARVASGVPIAAVSSPSHKVISTRESANEFQVLLDPSDRRALNRDFELVYRLSGDEVQSGLSLYERDGQGWFLWTMDAPKNVGSAMIPPREFIFVLDVSGSMNGAPLDTAKILMRDLAEVLRPTDYINAIKFAGGSKLMSKQSVGASQATVDRLLSFVSQSHGSGGTQLLPALERAFALPKVAATRTVVIVTDGGIGTIEQSARLISDSNGGVGTFVFGVGGYLSRSVLNVLADAGHSAPFLVDDVPGGDVAAAVKAFRAYVDRPLLSLVTLEFQGLSVADVHPQIVPVLYAARPLTVVGRYQPPASGKLIARGFGAKGRFERQIEIGAHRPDPHADALAFVWARREIDRLMLQGAIENRSQIEQIGLDYGVLTSFTSFVAVDQKIRNAAGASSTVQQPTPARAKPSPPPSPASYNSYAAGDLTDVLQQLPVLGSQAWQSLQALQPQQGPELCALNVLAGRAFAQTAGGWRELAAETRAPLIRIRRGGAAWQTLNELIDGFEQWSALKGEVLLGAGKQTLLIADSGFDHFPQSQLESIAAAIVRNASNAPSANSDCRR